MLTAADTSTLAAGFLSLPRVPVRLLVVTYYYPPSGGAGVQRPTKWVKYLPDAGVDPVVLTVREGAYPHHDTSLESDVEGVQALRTRAPDPFGLYGALTGRSRQQAVADRTGRLGESPALAERFSRWVRANLFVPDARVGWVPFALAGAQRLHRQQPIDAILTTGPPHSVHLIGKRLKTMWDVPWIADFRDPWTEIHYAGSLGRNHVVERLDRRLESSVLREADCILTVSSSLQKDLEARTDTPVRVIRNGFDTEDFTAVNPSVSSDTFDLVYVGSLFGVPTGLLDAVATLRDQGEINEFRLRFIGECPDTLAGAAEERGLGDIVSSRQPVAHEQAVEEMSRAALLLLTIESSWSYANGVIPGKTFEYLASGRPILGLGPCEGDAAVILAATGGGQMVSHTDISSIVQIIRSHYSAWEQGKPRQGASREAALPYSRSEGAKTLGSMLHALISGIAQDSAMITPGRQG